MHNLSTKSPQCSEIRWNSLKRGQAKGTDSRKIMWFFLWDPAGAERNLSLYFERRGNPIHSDGNWIVPDTTCLSLSASFSHCFSPGQSALWRQRLSFLPPPIFVTTDFLLAGWTTRLRVHDTNKRVTASLQKSKSKIRRNKLSFFE